MWRDLFTRRRALLTVECPHGSFVPARYEVGQETAPLVCDKCPVIVRLTWIRGNDRPSADDD